MFDSYETSAGPEPGAPHGAPLTRGHQPVHLLDRLSTLLKHRRIAGAAFLIVVTAMLVQSYSTIPTYESVARIEIQDERTMSAGAIGMSDPTFWQESEPYYQTQYQILRSRELARRVVRRLELQHHPDFSGEAPLAKDPLSLVRRSRASVAAWARGLAGSPAPAVPQNETADESALERGLIDAFLAGVAVVPVPRTRLVNVVYSHRSPEFASLAANTLAEQYAAQNLEQRLADTGKTLEWVNAELATATGALKAGEDGLQEYRESNRALSLDQRQDVVTQELNALNDSAIRARAERATRQNAYRLVRDAAPESDAADQYPAIGQHPQVVLARAALAALRTERASLLQRYGDDYPAVVENRQKIASAEQVVVAERRKVIDNLRNDYESALAAEQSFAAQLQQAKNASLDLSRKSGAYGILEREVDSQRKTYQALLERQQALAVAVNSRANNVRLVDRAETPRAPVSPDGRRDWTIALLAGFVIAFGLAFGLEYFDDTVKTPEDVTRRLGLPLLGLVPAMAGQQSPLLDAAAPHTFGEAFRSLRTSLVFTSGGAQSRIVAVTSSQPLEGKTTTACNLATALAIGGARVLLIDGDMRRPSLHRTLQIENGMGLSHLLVGQARLRDVIQRTTEPNLFAITAGRLPPNPSELLGAERMGHFLAKLAGGPFDWVLIDTPPVLAVTDAVLVAQKVSSVVFVIGSEMTRRGHAERALELLQGARVRSIGVVLNRVDFERNKYYYSRYYGYQYKSYYGQGTIA